MKRVLRIGYVEEEAPFIYSCFFNGDSPCKKPGISGDIWTEIAKRLNLTLKFYKADAYGGYVPDANGKFEGILGLIQDDVIDATLTFQSLRFDRFQYFNYTEAPLTYESGLVVGELFETNNQITVQVFDWIVVGFLAISLGLLWIYARLSQKFRHEAALAPTNTSIHLSKVNPILLRYKKLKLSLPNGILALIFTAVHLTYFAGFRSQALLGAQRSSPVVFQDFFANPNSKLIVRSNTSLTDDIREVIFGVNGVEKSQNRVMIEPDGDKIARILCTNSNIAHYTDRIEVFLKRRSGANCNLRVLSGNISTLSFKGVRAFIVSKSVARDLLPKINQIILKIFQIEYNENYLLPKYGLFPRNLDNGNQKTLYSQSIYLGQLTEGFVFFLVIYGVAICVLCGEVVYHTLYYREQIVYKRPVYIPEQKRNQFILLTPHLRPVPQRRWFESSTIVAMRNQYWKVD